MKRLIARPVAASVALSTASLLAFAAPAAAQKSLEREKPAITLKVGDPAPPLAVDKWVKGSPVESFQKGHAYVVEFWATWCGPCIKSMPHLSELQKKYGNRATIIGMTSVDKRNSLEAVEAMVAEKGDTMGYTVAWDVETKTTDTFRRAAGRNGIPCSFLIDGNGKVAWIGHPMWLDEPLASVVEGSWNIEAGNARMTKIESTYRGIYQHLRKEPKRSLQMLQGFERDYPVYAHVVEGLKFDVYLSAGSYDEAYKYGAHMVDKAIGAKDAYGLNSIAWKIVDPKAKIERRDLVLAMRAAKGACEITEYENAPILDTLARTYYLNGDLEKALEIQRKAVALADGRMKESLEEVLIEYQKAHLE